MTCRKRPKLAVAGLLAFAILFAQMPAALAQNKHVLPLFISDANVSKSRISPTSTVWGSHVR